MRTAAADRRSWAATPLGCRRRERWAKPVLAAGLCAGLLLGCAGEQGPQPYDTARADMRIPLPQPALLKPQPAPGCSSRTSRLQPRTESKPIRVANLAAGERSDSDVRPSNQIVAQVDPSTSLAQRIKLEYERDCYQRAEVRVRERLRRLQTAVGKTIKAVKRAETNAP